MPRLLLVVVSVVSLSGCHIHLTDFKEPNTSSCEIPDNVGKKGCPDGGAGVHPCKNLGDCTSTPDTPLCDTSNNSGTCVQCTAGDLHLCSGMTPLCVSDACTGCTNHSDCQASNVCMPDGSCALSSDVAYVDGTTGADGAPCTQALPCARIEDGVAKKSIVKVSGTVMHRCSLASGTAKIQILADPSAKLEPMENGAALEIKGNSNIEIYDLQIDNAQGGGSPGVALSETASLVLTRVAVRDNPGNGITVTGGVQLTCTRCQFTHNASYGIEATMAPSPTTQNPVTQKTIVTQSTLSDNMGGGIHVMGAGAFHIVNNFIFHNGQPGNAGSAGVTIQVNMQPATAPANELDFNSISHNMTADVDQGIQCTSGTPLIAKNNIIWNNGSLGHLVQVSSLTGCSYTFSDIGPTPDTPNMNVDPGFQDEASGKLHLTKDSMVRGKADPSLIPSGLAAKDIDGDARPTPADIGADQFVMP